MGADDGDSQMESTKCSQAGIVTFSLGLVAGTFSALTCKMAYDTSAVGLNGEDKLFAKPIMMLLLMFAAMVPAIFFWLFQQYFIVAKEDRDVVSYRTMAILIVPSVCDLLCTLLLLVAQLYISASMWQMLRGSVICITALMKRFLLGHRLRQHMWYGVTVITCAMFLVASTSFFGPTHESTPNDKDPRIGVILVILGCLAQGLQYVFEERVMAVDNAPPLVVIGCEGLWGTLLTVSIVYPLSYVLPGKDNGSFEDPWDALEMVKSSKSLQGLLVAFVITVTVYNCMAVYVTKYLSAIWHAILDNFRPVSIWGLDLCIYYLILPGQGFGEAWLPTSWLQLGGLLLLFLGTAVYNGDLGACDNGYETISLVQTDADSGDAGASPRGLELLQIKKTPLHMSSPALSRSPLVHRDSFKERAAVLPKETYSEI